MRVRSANGIRVHYSTGGDPSGRSVVFANSLGTDLRVWDRLIGHLPPGLAILRYDMRGHGLSDGPPGDYAIGDLVSDVAALMDGLGFRDAAFVGLSIGGLVAQGLAAARPDLVRAMVLSNTAARIGTPATWAERIAAVRGGGVAAIADGVLERWFSESYRRDRTDDLALWRNMLTRTPVDGYTGCCAALAAADLRAGTSELTLPAMAIAGSLDGATPPDLVRDTAALIRGCRFELIEGAGHIPCIETPETVGRLITEFLGENGLV